MRSKLDLNHKVIFLTANYKGDPLELVESLVPQGFQLITMETISHAEAVEKAKFADYILASGNLKIDAEILAAAGKLKMIQRLGVGLDSLDLVALEERNIPAYRNEGVNAESVAEHAVMFILACLRHLTAVNDITKSGIWKKQEQGLKTRELSTQTVGIIGMGNVGKKLAGLLKPFGCHVIYYSTHRMTEELEEEYSVEYKTLDELFYNADVISLHCPATDATNGIMRKENFDKMKNGVIIVNTSRGKLINETDLLNALDSGKVGFAALDVYQEEPISVSRLIQHGNVVCTPHIAGNTYDSFTKMMDLAFKNIVAYDQGRLADIETNRVNLR